MNLDKLDDKNPKVKERRIPKKAREIQDSAPADEQITAEQIVREAYEAQIERAEAAPKQQITSAEELADYKMRKRKEFEDNLRRNRMSIGTWRRYARWEAQQKEFERARSIYERVLAIDYKNHSIWLVYAEMEMISGFVNRARNVWNRAVQLLPRVDQLWYKFSYMEEQLRNYDGARRVFARWMEFKPGVKAWERYVALEWRISGPREQRLKRCREVYDQFVQCHPVLESFLKYATWEKKLDNLVEARGVYEKALQVLEEDANQPEYFIDFADMEIEAGEIERARKIFQYSLDHVPKHAAEDLFRRYTSFEKQYGDRETIETVILNRKRFDYKEKTEENEHNYDVWFDWIRLEEENGNVPIIRERYEMAVECKPLVEEKRYWRRYIYLWIKYALFEELITKDYDRARKIYDFCLKNVIPHEQFTFGKVWILYAEFEVRRKNLQRAKQILGEAIGKTEKKNVIKRYIEILVLLQESDNCRIMYQKWLELYPADVEGWIDYATMERKLQEANRVRSILDLATRQQTLDAPERVWKFYIDFEIEQEEHDKARSLYEKLLARTKNVHVWISFVQFECSIDQPEAARTIFERAERYFKIEAAHDTATDERVILLNGWSDFESEFGDEKQQEFIKEKQPLKVKRKRPLKNADGIEVGQEEYIDYVFPEENKLEGKVNLLHAAKLWKRKKESEV